MCNINLLMRKDRKPLNSEEIGIINIISYNSFTYNNDGEGYLGIGHKKIYVKKSEKKILFDTDKVKDSFMFATHERLTTSGNNNLMIHPHVANKIILMHNGVFRGVGNNKKSDTRIYTELLDKQIKKKNIIKAINFCNNKIQGSFSNLLYEIETGKLYYYKNYQTSMYYFEDAEYLIMCTTKQNVEIAVTLLNIKYDAEDIKEPRAFVLYDLLSKDCMFTGEQLRAPEVKQESFTIKNIGGQNVFCFEQTDRTLDEQEKEEWRKYENELREMV